MQHRPIRRLIDAITMFVVTGLSLLLLVYIGYGEGKRNFEQFQVQKLEQQGNTLHASMESFLRAGLPLKQYVGFNGIADPIVSNKDIDAIAVYDQAGRQIFISIDKANPKLPPPSPLIARPGDKMQVDWGDTHVQVILPLRNRFETVGSIAVMSPRSYISQTLAAHFRPLAALALLLSLCFAVFVSLTAPHLAKTRTPWLQIAYGVTFLGMAVALIGSLISLYSDGVRAKAEGAAWTLAHRMNDIVVFNLRIRDIDGLDKTFAGFRQLNPEIREAALIVNDVAVIDSDPAKAEKRWAADADTYAYTVDLTRQTQQRSVAVAVTVPTDLVYHQVERSVKNFAALFVASGFFAGLFLQVAASMQRLKTRRPTDRPSEGPSESALETVKPIFFLAVFLENLTYSFLPKYMQDVTRASGVSLAFTSAPFIAYYLCFALSLVPAGVFSDRHGPRPLIWSGLLLAGGSMAGLLLPLDIFSLTLARAVAGIGQGMLFIGIQSYILAVASAAKKTQGNAIIVFGFQGGMISGMAIGSLLVSYLEPRGVFTISAGIGAMTALYALVMMERERRKFTIDRGLGTVLRQIGGDMKQVLKSAEFLKTMFCIGVPAKAILTGVITFALPLLLGRQGYAQEEIGQVIMLYAIGVVVANGLAARLVDRTGKTDIILFCGAVASGAGLMLIGAMGTPLLGSSHLATIAAVAGVITVGAAHGLINAPVVTHVAHSRLAAQIGANPACATYRFLERLGHVAGPFALGQCFLIWGENAEIIAWIGVAITVLGFLFITRGAPPRLGAVGPEMSK